MFEKIKVNSGYKLMPAMSGMPKKLCFVSGRQGDQITLLLVNEIANAKVDIYAREFAQVKLRDGVYNLMTCNEVTDLNEVSEVCNIIRNAPYED